MGFLNARFPEDISLGATGGHAGFNTLVVAAMSGREYRSDTWEEAQGRWNVSQGIKRLHPDGSLSVDRRRYAAARNFFMMARGRLHAFRFKDWTDYVVARTEGRLVQITTTTFQLSKVYVYAGDTAFEYVRPITRPLASSLQVWLNGTLKATPADYTLGALGVVTFASAPGGATREVACEFDVPCRFDIDRAEPTIVNRKPDGTLLLEWDGIDIVEVIDE